MKIEDIKDEFKAIEEQEALNRERQLEDIRFGMADDQWPEELRRLRENDGDGARPCLTINKIQIHAKQITNNMRQNRSSIRVLPQDDNADVETAEIMQGMVRHIEHVSRASMAYDIAAEYQIMGGIGYFRIDTEVVDPLYNYQEILIKPVRNPFAVYFDPWCDDLAGADARRAFQTDHMSEDEFARMFPNAEPFDWNEAGRGDGWTTRDRIRVAEHWWLEEETVKYLFVQPRQNDPLAMPEDPKPMLASDYRAHEMMDTHLITGEAEVKENQLRHQILNGQEIIEGGESGKLLPGKYIPIVRVPGEDFYVEDERYVMGLVRRSMDAQRLYNYAASVNAEVSALAPKAPWVAGRKAMDGYEDYYAMANTKSMPFLPYNDFDERGNPLQPPMRQPPPAPNAQLHALMESANGDLQAVTGQFGASMGETTNERSGLAIHNRQKASDVATFHFTDNMAYAVQHGGRIIVDLIPKIYDTRRVARILGENDEPSTVILDPENAGEHEDSSGKIERIYDVGAGKYDVAVTTGPGFATRRTEAFESMARIVETNPQLWNVIGDQLVKNMDWPGSDDMAQRIKNMIPAEILGEEDEEQIIGQLQQQMQEMQMALEQTTQQLDMAVGEKNRLEDKLAGKEADKEMNAQRLRADYINKMQDREVDKFRAETDRLKARIGESEFESGVAAEADKLALQEMNAISAHERGVADQVLTAEQIKTQRYITELQEQNKLLSQRLQQTQNSIEVVKNPKK